MQFENGALKITNNICSLCNVEFENFVDHLVLHNHINRQFLTKDFCASLSLHSSLVSSQSLPMSLSSLQTLIFYLKSQKLPLYFKQLYSCHKCLLIFDSIHLLFSHLNKCDSNTLPTRFSAIVDEQSNEPIPDASLSNDPADNQTNDKEEDAKEIEQILKDDHDSDVEIVAEIAVTKSIPQRSSSNAQTVHLLKAGKVKARNETTEPPSNQQIRRIEIAHNEALILKSASFPRPTSPSKEFAHAGHGHKNGISPRPALESRSNKRLLRNLNKKPEPKRVEAKKKSKSKEESADTVVFNSASKKKFNKICGSIFKTLKCKFCNRGNFKHEQNLRAHYQNVHNFFPLQPQSESILSRFTSDEMNKYFQFRCLSCLKMFENFTTLSQHRCKYYYKQMHIPKKHSSKTSGKVNMMKPISSVANPESLPVYESESEFFKNIGLVRKGSPPYECEHVKLRLRNISSKSAAASKAHNNANILVKVTSSKCNKNGNLNGFLTRNNRPARSAAAKPTKPLLPDRRDDVIISLVAQPASSTRKYAFRPLKS